MNRLVIVGNGFDLAHGMKTGYNDFILWYLKFCFQEAYESQIYVDELLRIEYKPDHSVHFMNYKGVNQVVDFFYNSGRMSELIHNEILTEDSTMMFVNAFHVVIKSDFIRNLIDRCTVDHWVEIENEYYKTLKSIVLSRPAEKVLVDKLNQSLRFLISKLNEYLSDYVIRPSRSDYFRIITSEIMSNEIVTANIAKDANHRKQ